MGRLTEELERQRLEEQIEVFFDNTSLDMFRKVLKHLDDWDLVCLNAICQSMMQIEMLRTRLGLMEDLVEKRTSS